jgi:branched-chain amino acid transport system substrate-binding protein
MWSQTFSLSGESMTPRLLLALALVAAVAFSSCSGSSVTPVVVGAVYPTQGGQGPGGLDEYRGVVLAAGLANSRGGVKGRPIRLRLAPADSPDQAPIAVKRLAAGGAPVILGSYGSTISRPAAQAASRQGVVFWETGAVGDLAMSSVRSGVVFRFPATGAVLGRAAVSFARDVLLPKLGREAARLRFGVAYVDDLYGRSVGLGALREVRKSRLGVRAFPYRLDSVDYRSLSKHIQSARTDVLIVAAYLQDGIALRKEMVRRRVPLVASVGTSSSYCMPAFGEALGRDAVGLYASDKPDADAVVATDLTPGAARTLRWARTEFRRRFDTEMTAPALSGFSAAWALFHHVLPHAASLTPAAIARAAREVRVPTRGLPNGSGIAFGTPAVGGASENTRASSVIWEWVSPGVRAVVWPPGLATRPLAPLAIS